jgi:hypothetical protein
MHCGLGLGCECDSGLSFKDINLVSSSRSERIEMRVRVCVTRQGDQRKDQSSLSRIKLDVFFLKVDTLFNIRV